MKMKDTFSSARIMVSILILGASLSGCAAHSPTRDSATSAPIDDRPGWLQLIMSHCDFLFRSFSGHEYDDLQPAAAGGVQENQEQTPHNDLPSH